MFGLCRRSPSRFVTTRWSVLLAAQGDDAPAVARALDTLCSTYWSPLYVYARRRGHSPHDAEDLTQSFFAALLEKEYLRAAQSAKGPFRRFLLSCFKRFLANAWDHQQRLKRGGAICTVPLDASLAERLYEDESVNRQSPDDAYETRWALSLLDRTLSRLRAEWCRSGKSSEFDILKTSLIAERGAICYSSLGGDLAASEATVRVTVHRLRKRFREIFREEILQTVPSDADFQEEVRHLLASLAKSLPTAP